MMKKTNKYATMFMPLGMLFGLTLGISVYGILFDNVALGTSMGISLGLCLGLGIGAAKDAKINKQLEEFGYTVKAVNQTPDGYDVIVTDKNGGENAVPVSEKIQLHEKFKPGDPVYLSGTNIEQAYRG